MTQPVIAAEQVQRCVQVRVDLVYSVTDRFQSHPPVRSLWLSFASGHTSTTVQAQEQNTDVAAAAHRPLRKQRFAARSLDRGWFIRLKETKIFPLTS